ncbi:MAG: hypothetical protein IPL19_15420 [Sandaracinaceae bacterium]|nr:hypothetical protein [Sandaracinaceae bacterium]
MIQYVRGSFFEGRSFTDVDDLNEQLDAWVEQCAHQRAHPRDERRTVGALLEAERERLLPLPAHAPSTHRMEALRSGKLPYLRFDTNDYSIPHTLARKPLTLLADDATVRVMHGEVRRHARSQLREAPGHRGLGAHRPARGGEEARLGLRGRDRLRALCPHANALLEVIAARNEPVRQRTAKLNQLLDLYGANALDAAIVQALESALQPLDPSPTCSTRAPTQRAGPSASHRDVQTRPRQGCAGRPARHERLRRVGTSR